MALTYNTSDFGKLGKSPNHLGFLSNKNGQLGFNPDRFMSLTGLNPTEAGEVVGKARSQMYKDFIPLKPTDELRNKVLNLVMSTDIAYILFEKNAEETAKWVVSPNTLLFGSTPLEVCMRGDGKQLIKWLLDRAGQDTPDFEVK